MPDPASPQGSSRLWIVVIAALAVLFVAAWLLLEADAPDATDTEGQSVAAEPDLPRPVGSLDRPVPVQLTDGDPTRTDDVPPPPPVD